MDKVLAVPSWVPVCVWLPRTQGKLGLAASCLHPRPGKAKTGGSWGSMASPRLGVFLVSSMFCERPCLKNSKVEKRKGKDILCSAQAPSS